MSDNELQEIENALNQRWMLGHDGEPEAAMRALIAEVRRLRKIIDGWPDDSKTI